MVLGSHQQGYLYNNHVYYAQQLIDESAWMMTCALAMIRKIIVC